MKALGVKIKYTSVGKPNQGGRYEERHGVFKERLDGVMNANSSLTLDEAIDETMFIIK